MIPPIRYTTVAAIIVAFVLAALVVRIAHALVHRLLGALDIAGSENRAAVHARARQLIRALTLLAYGVAAVASVTFALSRFGVADARWDPRGLTRWFFVHGVNAGIIVVGAYIVIRAANLGIEHLQYKLGQRHSHGEVDRDDVLEFVQSRRAGGPK